MHRCIPIPLADLYLSFSTNCLSSSRSHGGGILLLVGGVLLLVDTSSSSSGMSCRSEVRRERARSRLGWGSDDSGRVKRGKKRVN